MTRITEDYDSGVWQMGEIEYPSNADQWARDKQIKRPCSTCKREYDPHLLDTEYNECPDCHSERLIREKEKRKRKELWDRIVWPEQ